MRRSDLCVAGAVVSVLVLGLGLLLWPDTGGEDFRVARATVLQPAHCGSPDARDILRIELLDGRQVLGRLNGCGNHPGELLTVEVPDPLPAESPPDDLVVRLAGTGVPAPAATAQRLSAVLVGLAGVGGALLAWRLRHEWSGNGRRV